MGLLAVHNPDPLIEGADEVLKVVGDFEDHHLFNKWWGANPLPKYKDFWGKVFGSDFDVDDFCVSVEKSLHREMSPKITAKWKAFIDDQYRLIRGGTKMDVIRRNTMDKMLDIAEEFKLDVHKVARYRSSGTLRLDKLWRLANKCGKIDLRKHKAWRRVIGKAGKWLGKGFRKALPVVSVAIIAYGFINSLDKDAVEVLAAELDLPEETVEGWFAGTVHIDLTGWITGNYVDVATLADGGEVHVGDYLWVWSPATPPIKEKYYCKVISILTQETPGVVRLRLEREDGRVYTIDGVNSVAKEPPE